MKNVSIDERRLIHRYRCAGGMMGGSVALLLLVPLLYCVFERADEKLFPKKRIHR